MVNETKNIDKSGDTNCDGFVDNVTVKTETTRFLKRKKRASESFTRLEAFLNSEDAKRFLRDEKN